jgi:pullulanase
VGAAVRIDAFRFDLMGHHMKDDMLAVRRCSTCLTLDEIVDGVSIYVYGEGWDFGEVAGNARGVNATQRNMAGTGIGTFNDRLRDAVRGGSPFGGQHAPGLHHRPLAFDPNDYRLGTAEDNWPGCCAAHRLVRSGWPAIWPVTPCCSAIGERDGATRSTTTARPPGYTADPQENIVYVRQARQPDAVRRHPVQGPGRRHDMAGARAHAEPGQQPSSC